MVPALCVFAALYTFFVRDTLSIILIVMALICAATQLLLYVYVPVRSFKKDTNCCEDYHLVFSPDSIVIKTATNDSTLDWDVYKEYWENSDSYFIIQPSHLYTLIPKRAITAEQRLDFHDLLSASLPCAKKIGSLKKEEL